MEDKKEKFKLSSELELIFQSASELTKNKSSHFLDADTIIYFILDKYFKDEGENETMNQICFDLISVVSKREATLKIAKNQMEISLERYSSLPDELKPYFSGDIPFTPSLDLILKDSISISNSLFSTSKIETDVFFLSYLNNSPKNNLINFLSYTFNITGKTVLDLISKNEDLGLEPTKDLSTLGSLALQLNPDLKDKIMSEDDDELEFEFNDEKEEDNKENSNNDNEDKEKNKSTENDDKLFQMAGNVGPEENILSSEEESKTPYLDKYGFDMTKAARNKKYFKIIGREKELQQLIEILCCKKKNNALILSQFAGSGKTALVELLAQKIVKNEVPEELIGKKLISLNLNSMASGTKWRGSAEERWDYIIKEVTSNPSIIIFIDEFQCLLNNGNSSGSGSGSDILKPYLARGEFQTIGALLIEDYRKQVEPEQALRRRFQNVVIEEPSIEDTIKILNGVKSEFSNYHKVKYSPEIIKSCVELSGRYINDRYFPDKAIDCLDLAGSLCKLNKTEKSTKKEYIKIKKEIEDIIQKKISYIRKSDFSKGSEYRDKEKELEQKLIDLKNKNEKEEHSSKNWPEVTIDDVVNIVSKISKIPVDQIGKSDTEKIISMKSKMEKSIIGQSEAIDSVTLALQRNILGLRDENKPLAALFFAGASSTGKTLCCKELAKEFFGDEKNLIRFDMGEFTLSHEVTKLTGATSSYVGYTDEPLLYAVKRRPYSVVLFDEIEKSAPEINNIFLNILSEGYITLGNGTRVDFKNTIVVFTSNLGSSDIIAKGDGFGFSKMTKNEKKADNNSVVLKAIRKHFKPEFINRLSDIIVFNDLYKKEFEQIFDIEFNKLKNRLKKSKNGVNFNIKISKGVKEKIVSDCKNAREIERGIEKQIENNICKSILFEKIDPKEILEAKVDYKDEKFTVEFTKNKKKSTKTNKETENDTNTKSKTEEKLVEDNVN